MRPSTAAHAPTTAPLDYAPTAGSTAVPWPVWLVVVLAVVLRLAASASRPPTSASLAALPDQQEYVAIAESIRAGTGVRFADGVFNDVLYAYRMPAYPALIALCRCELRLVQAVQALLDGSAVLAVHLIGRRFGREAVGPLAAISVAVNPYLIYFSTLLLSETLFTAVLAWAVWALLGRATLVRCIGVLLLVSSVYVRPSALGLGVLAAVTFAAGLSGGLTWRRGTAAALVATGTLALLLLPWALRNRTVTGSYVWLTTNDGFTAYDAFNPRADGSSDQAWFRAELLRKQEAEEVAESASSWRSLPKTTWAPTSTPALLGIQTAGRPMPWMFLPGRLEVRGSKELSQEAWSYAVGHPVRDVELAFLKLGRFWSPVPLSAEFGGKWLYVIVGGVYCVPLFVFTAVGVWRGRLGRLATFTLLLPAIYFSLVHSIAVGSLRYRVPCDVPLTVLAAAGVVSCFKPRPVT